MANITSKITGIALLASMLFPNFSQAQTRQTIFYAKYLARMVVQKPDRILQNESGRDYQRMIDFRGVKYTATYMDKKGGKDVLVLSILSANGREDYLFTDVGYDGKLESVTIPREVRVKTTFGVLARIRTDTDIYGEKLEEAISVLRK